MITKVGLQQAPSELQVNVQENGSESLMT
jgi:hypothetical protein